MIKWGRFLHRPSESWKRKGLQTCFRPFLSAVYAFARPVQKFRKTAQKQRALTFVEMIITLTIFMILIGLVLPLLMSTLLGQQLSQADRQLLHVLRKAQTQASSQYQGSSWGVSLDSVTGEYILFAGDTYATRNLTFDISYELPSAVSFGSISLNGGGAEILFLQDSGRTSDYGTIELMRGGESSTLTIDALGHARKD